jgi:hypothetical protein
MAAAPSLTLIESQQRVLSAQRQPEDLPGGV